MILQHQKINFLTTLIQVLVGSLVENCSKDIAEATAETLDEVMECGQEKVKVILVSDANSSFDWLSRNSSWRTQDPKLSR